MRFDEVLDDVGGFSKFQFLVLLLLCLPRVILPLHFLLHNFISATPLHHCALGTEDSGTLLDPETLALGVPREDDGSFSSCMAYATPLTLDPGRVNQTNVSMVVPCPDGWVYDHSQFSSTTATQWDLVCDDRKLNQALATFFFGGVTLGAIVFGQLSDKFGRKPMILVSYAASAMFGVILALSNSYTMFAVTRTLCGVALTGMSITTMALSIEWIDIKHRTFTGTIISVAWSVGNMLLALLAYCIRDWRHLVLVVTSPCIAAIISWWWIPESARWLLVNGEVERAQKYLIQCAKMNGKDSSKLDTETLRKVTVPEVAEKNHSYLDLFRTPKLRKITICSGIFWFAVPFIYYGISFKITGFGLNMYLTQFVYGAIEIPAKCGTYFVLDLIGRRNCQAWSLITTGALIALNIAIPTDYAVVRTCIAVIGKGFSEAAFTTAFLYTAELYPTVLRQCGLGYTSFIGRLGGSLAPMIILLEAAWVSLPPLIFATTGVISGAVVFLLPETLNTRLPENIPDVEEDRHKQSPTEEALTSEMYELDPKKQTEDTE